MNDKQRIELRNSEIRSRLSTLGTAEGTDEGKAEIDTLAVEYSSNETRLRAFMVAGDAPVETTTSKEGQERAELYAEGQRWRFDLQPGQRALRRPGRRDGRASEGNSAWQTMKSTLGSLRRKATT